MFNYHFDSVFIFDLHKKKKIGIYDFAGGGPVHIASGFSALAFCLFVGPRKVVRAHSPSSLGNMVCFWVLL